MDPENFRCSHIYTHRPHDTFVRAYQKTLNARCGLQRDLCLFCQAAFIHISADTPRGIPAHFGFASVRIVHPHLKICTVTRLDQYQPVASDSEMPVADDA